jgi:phosphatidylethanolamine-binding protein (PEBP) family uncharacterized protein
MRQVPRVTSGAMLLLALALAGCSKSGATTTAITRIPFKSAAIVGTSLPARYTCDGRNSPPPLEWGAVPAGTRELALLIIGLKPTLTPNTLAPSIEWAVAGLNPALHRISSSRLPAEAHLGSTSGGGTRYSICPKKGRAEVYQFTLYAVPPTVTIPPGFAGLQVLIEVGASGGSAVSSARGSFEVSYKRS